MRKKTCIALIALLWASQAPFCQNANVLSTLIDILAPAIIENSGDKAQAAALLDIAKDTTVYLENFANLSNNLIAQSDKYVRTSGYSQDLSNKKYYLINTLFKRLLASPYHSNRSINWQIYLCENREINAYALPNGAIIVNSGMIDFCLNDDELALIIGHEMAHIELQHSLDRAREVLTTQTIVAQLAKRVNYANDADAQAFNMLYGLGGQLAVLKFSRDDERAADKYGAIYAASMGYDPLNGYNLWARMASVFSAPPVFLSTHPASSERSNEFLVANYGSYYCAYTGALNSILEYSDDFSDYRSGWNDAIRPNNVANGYYNSFYLMASEAQLGSVSSYPAPIKLANNYCVLFDMYPLSGCNGPSLEIQVVFDGDSNSRNALVFNKGIIRIMSYHDGSWHSLESQNYELSKPIKVMIQRVNGLVRVYFDGALAISSSQCPKLGPYFFFVNGFGNAQVLYDNFQYFSYH